MPTLRIVLVEPREAGNVGAAARVMKNFGFEELWIVGEHPELLPVSGWWASGADDVLAAAHFAPTLNDAVADAHLTVATTSMRARTSPVSFTSRTLAERFASLSDQQTLALVFGREVAEARGTAGASVVAVAMIASADGLALPALVDPEGYVFAFGVTGPTRIEIRPASAEEMTK